MRKTTPLIILLLLMAVIYPFAEKRYIIFMIFFTLIIVLALIQLILIPKYIKIILSLIIIVFYHRNIVTSVHLLKIIFKLVFIHPSSKRQNNDIPREIVTHGFEQYFHFKTNFECIPKTPTIFVANYVSDRFENIACITIPNISIILGNVCVDKVKIHKIIKNVIVKKHSTNQYDSIKTQIDEHYKNGSSLFAYIEEPSTVIGDGVGRLRSGMFSIAKELNITVTPVVFDHIEYNKLGMIYDQNYRIKIGETFHVHDVKQCKYITRKFYRDTLKEFKKKKFENIY